MINTDPPLGPVLQILRIALNVADLDGACAFYTGGLGFTLLSRDGASARLRLGGQELQLDRAGPDARPYPQPRAANDPWFQHFAIAVADMDQAYRRLAAHPQQPISHGGPQLLPPSTGSVTAYKFRDPDGHPLELSHIPDSAWAALPRTGEPCLGIDHSALAVRDLDRSLAFYTGALGLRRAGGSLNHGPEQDRLDGLPGAVVDIVALETARGGPHIELLHYRSPQPASGAGRRLEAGDIAATRLVMAVGGAGGEGGVLRAAGARGAAAETQRQTGVLTSDPDGHLLELIRS